MDTVDHWNYANAGFNVNSDDMGDLDHDACSLDSKTDNKGYELPMPAIVAGSSLLEIGDDPE